MGPTEGFRSNASIRGRGMLHETRSRVWRGDNSAGSFMGGYQVMRSRILSTQKDKRGARKVFPGGS